MRRKISKRVNFFAASTTQHTAPEKEQRDIRSKPGSQFKPGRKRQAITRQTFQDHQGDGRVAAAPTQPGSHGNFLFEPKPDPTSETARPLPECSRTVNQVVPFRRKPLMVTFQVNTLLTGGNSNLEVISQPHCLVDSSDFVIAIRSFAENLQSQVDFGKRAGLGSLRQGMRQAGIVLLG